MPILALLKLVPIRDWLYAALAVAAVVFWFHHDHVEQAKGAARVTAAVQAATAKANAAADAEIARLTSTHATDVAQIEDRYEQNINYNDAAYAADLQRLRERAARDRAASQVLGSAGSGAAPPDARTGSAEELGSVPAEQALALSNALRADDASLDKCYADRDSLTGK